MILIERLNYSAVEIKMIHRFIPIKTPSSPIFIGKLGVLLPHLLWVKNTAQRHGEAFSQITYQQRLKDVDMLQRLHDIRTFGEKEKDYIFFTLDALIRDVKNRKQYAL